MRPQVTVKDSPAAWWQHAGYAALQECRLISRRQFPFSGMARRRSSRQLYQVRLNSVCAQRPVHDIACHYGMVSVDCTLPGMQSTALPSFWNLDEHMNTGVPHQLSVAGCMRCR